MNSDDSRYARNSTVTRPNPRREGEDARVVRLRMAKQGRPARTHKMKHGQRLEHLAYAFYGDAGQWWRSLDAEDAVFFAEELEEPGRLVTLPRDEE
ncbi:MAG: hypothetical protein ACQEVA_01070 [Myxococcota bacterium]